MTEVLPWHRPIIERLRGLADADRLPNTIALSCAPGWGHESLLAQVSLALLEVETEQPVYEFAHPDFRWLAPDGAVIKVDQVRRLIHFAVQTPQSAPRKIAAIVDAHLLNPNAANALLKTLEEPPRNTHVLLATSQWGKLLPTVRSRCQRFQISPDPGLARSWLSEQGVAMTDAEFAEFGFAPLTARDCRQSSSLDMTQWLAALGSVPLAGAVEPVLEADVVDWLGRWYRRVLLHVGGSPVPGCEASHSALIGFTDEIVSVRRQIESTNAANVRLLLESLIVRWLQLQRRPAA